MLDLEMDPEVYYPITLPPQSSHHHSLKKLWDGLERLIDNGLCLIDPRCVTVSLC